MASSQSGDILECQVCKTTYNRRGRLKKGKFSCKMCLLKKSTQNSGPSRDVNGASKLVNVPSFTGEKFVKFQNVRSRRQQEYCLLCGKGFMFRRHYYNHVSLHSSSKPSMCGICGKTFDQHNEVLKHMDDHFKEIDSYTCFLCMKSFSQSCNLERHLLYNCNKLLLTCFVCKKKCATRSEVIAHWKTHEPNSNAFSVGSLVRKKEDLKLKTKISDSTGFCCSTCNANFPDRSKLELHMSNHLIEKSFDCGVCERKFKYKCNLAKHLQVHSAKDRFYCQLCMKGFVDVDNLIRHTESHNKEVQLSDGQMEEDQNMTQSDNCKETQKLKEAPFVNNGNRGNIAGEENLSTGEDKDDLEVGPELFQRRTRSHNGVSQSDSDTCGKNSFSTVKSIQHETLYPTDDPITLKKLISKENEDKSCNKTTAVSKKFVCSFCSKGFTHQWNLRSHVALLHPNKKSFLCNLCPEIFFRKWMFVKHMEDHSAKNIGYDNDAIPICDTSKLNANIKPLKASMKKSKNSAVPLRKCVSQDRTGNTTLNSDPQQSNYRELDRKLSRHRKPQVKERRVSKEYPRESVQSKDFARKDIEKRLSGNIYPKETFDEESDEELPDPSDFRSLKAQGFDKQVSKYVQEQKTSISEEELPDTSDPRSSSEQDFDKQVSKYVQEESNNMSEEDTELPDLTSLLNHDLQEKNRPSSVCLDPTESNRQNLNAVVVDDLQKMSSKVPSQGDLQEISEFLLTTDMSNRATVPSDICQSSFDRTKDQHIKEIIQAVRLYKCSVCKLEMTSKEMLVEHLKVHNAKEIFDAFVPNKSQKATYRSLKRRGSLVFPSNSEREDTTREFIKQINLENSRLQSSIAVANDKQSGEASLRTCSNESLNAKVPRYADSQESWPDLVNKSSEHQDPRDRTSSVNNISDQLLKKCKRKQQFTCKLCKEQFYCRIKFHKHCKLHPEWGSFSYKESIEEVVLRIRKVKSRNSSKKNKSLQSYRVQKSGQDKSSEKVPSKRKSSFSNGNDNEFDRFCDKHNMTPKNNLCMCNMCSGVIQNRHLENQHQTVMCSENEQLCSDQVNHEQLDPMRLYCYSESPKNRMFCRGRGNRTSRNRMVFCDEAETCNQQYYSMNEGYGEGYETNYTMYEELGNTDFVHSDIGPYVCYKCKEEFASENLHREHEQKCFVAKIKDNAGRTAKCSVSVYSIETSQQIIGGLAVSGDPQTISHQDFNGIMSDDHQVLESESALSSEIPTCSSIQEADDLNNKQSKIDCVPKSETQEVKCEVTENFYYKESAKKLEPVHMQGDELSALQDVYETLCGRVLASLPPLTHDSLMAHSCEQQNSLDETTDSCSVEQKIVSWYEYLVVNSWMSE